MKPETLKLLSQAVKDKRLKLRLSLRDVYNATGVSPSTISRVEHLKGNYDTDTLSSLADWAEIPLETIICGDSGSYPPAVSQMNAPLPEIVSRHLANDKNLTAENAARLSEIFRVSYEQFTSYSKGVEK